MMQHRHIKTILSFARNPQVWVCIAIAAFFWVFNRLGNTYTADVLLPITITGVGDGDKHIDESNIDVHSTVRANGYTILYLRLADYFHRYKFTIADIDMKRSADSTYFELPIASMESTLRRRFGNYVEQLSVNDTQLTVSARNYRQKVVPVIANYSIDLSGKRMPIDQIKIDPCSVIVGGTSAMIDTLTAVYTEKFKVTPKRDNYEGEVRLSTLPTLIFSEDKVKYTVVTEQYTEIKRAYPIVIRAGSDSLAKEGRFVLPEQATVTFNITKDQYARFSPEDITLFVEYDGAEKDNAYIVRCQTKKENITIVDIVPRTAMVLNVTP